MSSNNSNIITDRLVTDDPEKNFYYKNHGITQRELENPKIINEEFNQHIKDIAKKRKEIEKQEKRIRDEYARKASFLNLDLQVEVDEMSNDTARIEVKKEIRTISHSHSNKITDLKGAVYCDKLKTNKNNVIKELVKFRNLISKIIKNYNNFYPDNLETLERHTNALKLLNIFVGDAGHNQSVYSIIRWIHAKKVSIDYTANVASKQNEIHSLLCENCTNIKKKQFVLMSFDISSETKWRCLKCHNTTPFSTYLSSNHIKKNLKESLKIQLLEKYIVLNGDILDFFIDYSINTLEKFTGTQQVLKRNKRGKYSE